jgi:hypothetical protein
LLIGWLTGLVSLNAPLAPATEFLLPQEIIGPSVTMGPGIIQGPSEVIFPSRIVFPQRIVFPPVLRFPATVTYPARIAPPGPIIVRQEDIPHLDPLTVEWLLGRRDDAMVPMRILSNGQVVPLRESDEGLPGPATSPSAAAEVVQPASVHAADAGIEWDTLNREVKNLYRAGHYDQAIVVAKKALEVAEYNVGPHHPAVATSLNNLALLYYAKGDYAAAEPLYKRALAIDEKALGPTHPDVATSLNNLAALYRVMQRDAEATLLEQRAAAIQAMRR